MKTPCLTVLCLDEEYIPFYSLCFPFSRLLLYCGMSCLVFGVPDVTKGSELYGTFVYRKKPM